MVHAVNHMPQSPWQALRQPHDDAGTYHPHKSRQSHHATIAGGSSPWSFLLQPLAFWQSHG